MIFISLALMGLLIGCSEPIIYLAQNSTANCYIVSHSGTYTFPTVKGNSSESVGIVATADVLWECLGTDEQPVVGDLIEEVSFSDGFIRFVVPVDFKKGNAVIAARDASGTILWSWHIWMTEMPKEQEYFNGAGTMMDRNLGATSKEFGYGCGLLYYWGRKDPFLNLSDKATVEFPQEQKTSPEIGTIEYSIANPMLAVCDGDCEYSINGGYWEWERSDDLWRSYKTMYDPCPEGWRVPDASVWIESLQLEKYRRHVRDDIYAECYDEIGDIWDKEVKLCQLYRAQQDYNIWYPKGTYWSVSHDLTLDLFRATIQFTFPSYPSHVRCQKVK